MPELQVFCEQLGLSLLSKNIPLLLITLTLSLPIKGREFLFISIYPLPWEAVSVS